MTRNGYGDSLNDGSSRLSMLDRALEGASTEAKARVRGVLLRYGIDEDNEFFLIFVAMGQLLALVEDAPENWRALFDDITEELNQWASQNREPFDSLQLHTQASAELVEYLKQALSGQSEARERSNRALAALDRVESKATFMQNCSFSMSEEMSQVAAKLDDYSTRISRLTELVNQQSWALALSFGGVLVLIVACIFLALQNRSQRAVMQYVLAEQQAQSEQIAWLLEKARRAECRQGILSPDDPQCQ